MPLLLNVVVIFFGSVVVLIQVGNFWVMPVLHSVSYMWWEAQRFYRNPRSHLKTLGARRVTWSKYRVGIKSFPDYKHLLRCTSEEFQPWIIFQQGGAPPHWGSQVRWFLDGTFPNRWIGRDGLTPWPPRSPVITPLDSFLWGYVKDKVFSTPVPDMTCLKARITDAFATITERMLENTWGEIDYRLDVLCAAKRVHVEVY